MKASLTMPRARDAKLSCKAKLPSLFHRSFLRSIVRPGAAATRCPARNRAVTQEAPCAHKAGAPRPRLPMRSAPRRSRRPLTGAARAARSVAAEPADGAASAKNASASFAARSPHGLTVRHKPTLPRKKKEPARVELRPGQPLRHLLFRSTISPFSSTAAPRLTSASDRRRPRGNSVRLRAAPARTSGRAGNKTRRPAALRTARGTAPTSADACGTARSSAPPAPFRTGSTARARLRDGACGAADRGRDDRLRHARSSRS